MIVASKKNLIDSCCVTFLTIRLNHKTMKFLTTAAANAAAVTTYKPIKESRVAVIGGSIGGCAVAIALKNMVGVKKVDVYERSQANDLADRGLGIGFSWSDLSTISPKRHVR